MHIGRVCLIFKREFCSKNRKPMSNVEFYWELPSSSALDLNLALKCNCFTLPGNRFLCNRLIWECSCLCEMHNSLIKKKPSIHQAMPFFSPWVIQKQAAGLSQDSQLPQHAVFKDLPFPFLLFLTLFWLYYYFALLTSRGTILGL